MKSLMIKERMMIFIKKQLKNFYEETVNEDSLDYVAEIMDHYSEDIADGIFESKWDLMYDLVIELLKDNANNNRWGFEVMNDDYIFCERETDANVLASFLENCGCDTIHTYEFPDKSGWLVYPDGL